MSGFNSVDDFYDVMAGRHGLHESEQSGSTLELYSCNGAEFPDGLDGCSLDVITAPSPEFLAYMRGNDSPVPPSGYKDMADEIKGIWDVYNSGSAEADWGRLAELYDDNNLSLSVIVDYEFMDWPETLGDILNGKGADCWNLDGMVWHLYNHEACTLSRILRAHGLALTTCWNACLPMTLRRAPMRSSLSNAWIRATMWPRTRRLRLSTLSCGIRSCL